jgi:hypothetical protein
MMMKILEFQIKKISENWTCELLKNYGRTDWRSTFFFWWSANAILPFGFAYDGWYENDVITKKQSTLACWYITAVKAAWCYHWLMLSSAECDQIWQSCLLKLTE